LLEKPMFLARLRLDPASAQARRDLSDPYNMHRTLVRAFVTEDQSAVPRFLWRMEPVYDWKRPEILVSAERAGDWRFLEGEAGYLRQDEDGGVACRQIDLATVIQPDAVLRFRMAANPTVTRAGKRLGLVGEDGQLEWLGRQGERHGFQVLGALVSGGDMMYGRRQGGRVSLLRVLFDGVMQVRDPQLLRQAMLAGIGPGKAFGCGMLSVRAGA
jgi:CRISPR system Cascade subunit CasE